MLVYYKFTLKNKSIIISESESYHLKKYFYNLILNESRIDLKLQLPLSVDQLDALPALLPSGTYSGTGVNPWCSHINASYQSDLYNLTKDIYAANIEFYFDELISKSLHICFILTLFKSTIVF